MEVTSCFGSVIGVRYGQYWSFYLQQNAFVQDLQFLKRSEVQSIKTGALKTYSTKSSNLVVERNVVATPRKLGQIPLGSKKVKTYVTRFNNRCYPVRVQEIYPTRTFSGEFVDFAVKSS